MTNKSVFSFKELSPYLRLRLAVSGPTRGLRVKLGEELRVNSSYITKLLAGDITLSIDHAVVLNRFLGHTEDEGEYFILLAERAGAATQEGRRYLDQKIEQKLEKRWIDAAWLKSKAGFPEEAQAVYFSEWYYIVIHVLTGIPGYQNRDAIAKRLGLSLPVVSNAIEFLRKAGLIEDNGGRLTMTQRRVHVSGESPWISHHHRNVRDLAIRSMDHSRPLDVHYSFVMSVSKTDREKVQARVKQFISELEEVFEDGPKAESCALAIDFFGI